MEDSNENLEKEFFSLAEKIKNSDKNLDNDTLLKLYGYYKQATIGDCNVECPAFWKINDKLKWEAWDKHRGLKKKHSMKKYIKLVNEILDE
jgi:diazepam-binding inhibitor (GABA receptor modulating acyl-CoA-binding protein)